MTQISRTMTTTTLHSTTSNCTRASTRQPSAKAIGPDHLHGASSFTLGGRAVGGLVNKSPGSGSATGTGGPHRCVDGQFAQGKNQGENKLSQTAPHLYGYPTAAAADNRASWEKVLTEKTECEISSECGTAASSWTSPKSYHSTLIIKSTSPSVVLASSDKVPASGSNDGAETTPLPPALASPQPSKEPKLEKMHSIIQVSPDISAEDRSPQRSLPLAYTMTRQKHEQRRPPPWIFGLGAAVLYGVCSSSMAFANKGLMSSYKFNYQVTLMAFQMAFTLIVLEAMRALKLLDLPHYTFSRGRTFALPSLFYAINSVLGLRALTGMNIPMYTVIKRCTPAVCIFLRPLLLQFSKPPTSGIKCSVALVIVGCILATYGDLAFELVAYTNGSLSVIVQALYLTLVQRDTQKQVSTSHSLYLNSYNTLPFLVAYAALSGELREAANFPDLTETSFLLLLFLVVSMGCLLNYSLFLCTSMNSALTTTIVGSMKGVVQTVIGVFTFGGMDLNGFSVFGLTVNASGGLLYAYFKFKQRG